MKSQFSYLCHQFSPDSLLVLSIDYPLFSLFYTVTTFLPLYFLLEIQLTSSRHSPFPIAVNSSFSVPFLSFIPFQLPHLSSLYDDHISPHCTTILQGYYAQNLYSYVAQYKIYLSSNCSQVCFSLSDLRHIVTALISSYSVSLASYLVLYLTLCFFLSQLSCTSIFLHFSRYHNVHFNLSLPY